MKIQKIVISALVMLGAFCAHAQTQQKKNSSLHDQFTGQQYGMAGCGLGSVVFADKPGMIQIVAATLNGTSMNQSFGLTFGTSNCAEKEAEARASDFIEVNKVALENDLVRGDGEVVASLQRVMGCVNNDFSSQLRNNYSVGLSADELTFVASKSCKL